MAAFYWCDSIVSRLEPLWGSGFLFTTKFTEISGTHYYMMKGWVSLGATKDMGPLDWGLRVLLVDSNKQILFGGFQFCIWYIILFLGQGCWSFNQYNLQDGMLQLNSNPTLYWRG